VKVTVRQKEDFHFVGTGEDYSGELPIDAAGYVGGKGRGHRPPALLMYSLAGCMGIHTYEGLHKAGKHVESMEVSTDGERRTEAPKVFTSITLKFRISGSDLTGEDIKQAIHDALTRSCSIAVMINRVAPITCEYECGSIKGTVTAQT